MAAKYLILGGEFMSDELLEGLREALAKQYGEDPVDWNDWHLFVACSQDNGEMFKELYAGSPEWQSYTQPAREQ